MSGYALHDVDDLSARVRRLGESSTRLLTLRDRLDSELATKEKQVTELTEEIEVLTKTLELFRHLMDLLVVKQTQVIEGVVTEGLKAIFHDIDLAFEAEVGPKYNKIAVDFFIRQGPKEDSLSHRGRPLDAFGGGPSSVASLALRILTVLRLKLWPFLVLDETLAAVSDEYTDPTGQFLQTLARKMGLDVLLVTHKQGYLDHADTAYRCMETVEDDGVTRSLSLRSIK